jgi:hypothetical protein
MMYSKTFAHMQTQTASTKRSPAAVGNVIGAPVEYLTGLSVLPLMPVTDDIVKRYSLESPRQAFVTYVLGTIDILEGDILVIDAVEHPVRAASAWPAHDYVEVIVDRVVGI